MLPNFIIIGAARCATTWTARNLKLHPDIFMPNIKELHFFDRHYARGIECYESHFKGARVKALGEATPAYLYFPQIPSLIKKHIPEVKLIVSLRNPIDRAYSHYWNLLAKNTNKKSISGSFEKEMSVNKRIVEEGMYFNMLQRYYNEFPAENILILRYEGVEENPILFLRKIYEFLDVDTGFVPSLISQKLNSSEMKHGRSKLLALASRGCIKKLGLFGVGSFLSNINSKEVPIMAPQTRMVLRDIYSEPNKRLEELINIDVSDWS